LTTQRCLLGVIVASALAACAESHPSAQKQQDPLSGGATTVFDATKGAYANPAANLTTEHLDQFNFGHSVFSRNWVTAPATTDGMDGLGPIFNARACSSCHSRDGRSPPFDPNSQTNAMLGLLVRISIPGTDEHGGPLGDPVYGTQVRPYGVLGVPGEATCSVEYEELAGSYADGTTFSLRAPTYSLAGWNYGEPADGLMLSARTGPATIGLGLLSAISEDDLLANARDEADADGVKGHANYVWDVSSGSARLGRFGWKANQPSVLQQASGALSGDMGITSSLFPNEACTAPMVECQNAVSGGTPEITDDKLTALVSYMQTLAVPARRDLSDASVQHGEELFSSFGCASCHVTTFETSRFEDIPEFEGQTIHPYTDLLLHDMGPELADNRPDFLASGSDWRTPPLWGIGLLQTVNGHQFLLHDGRARGFEEAILWHGGEGETARERFRNASAGERGALLSFLGSL